MPCFRNIPILDFSLSLNIYYVKWRLEHWIFYHRNVLHHHHKIGEYFDSEWCHWRRIFVKRCYRVDYLWKHTHIPNLLSSSSTEIIKLKALLYHLVLNCSMLEKCGPLIIRYKNILCMKWYITCPGAFRHLPIYILKKAFEYHFDTYKIITKQPISQGYLIVQTSRLTAGWIIETLIIRIIDFYYGNICDLQW